MEKDKQNSLDSWDEFISGNFLKAENVNEGDVFVVTDVSLYTEEGRETRPRIHVERNGVGFDFDLNKTNSVKVKELGVESPKALVGKKIYFIKVMVRNPQLNKEVPGLRISKIE